MAEISLLEVSGESCANCLTLLPVVNRLAAARGWKVEHLEANEQNAQRVNALGIDRERFQPDLVLALGKPAEKVRVTSMPPGGSTAYWRDAEGVHHVPKRALADVLL